MFVNNDVLLAISVLLANIILGDAMKNCDDCMKYTDCTQMRYIYNKYNYDDQALHEKIEKEKCDKDSMKVCCSAFDLPNACGIPFGSYRRMRTPRIVRGENAKLYEIPWMALIIKNKEYTCGGSIITNRYILTAAHCVNKQDTIEVLLGGLNYNLDLDCDTINYQQVCESSRLTLAVEKIIIHKNFNPVTLENDIGLLRVVKEIPFDKTIAPVCLPITPELRAMNLWGAHVTVAGWGFIDSRHPSGHLKKAHICVTNCTAYNKGRQHKIRKTICAGGKGGDTCTGDSGGPLYMETTYYNNKRFVQFGITSAGATNCGSRPGTYTDVRKYVDWIRKHIKT